MRDLRAALHNQPPAEHEYDWAPIHMPGSVQSYGVLLVTDPQTRRVLFVSDNAQEMFGIAPADILDKSYLLLTENERERNQFKDKIGPETILFPNPLRMTVNNHEYDAVFHAHAGAHLIEIEPAGRDDASYADMSMRATSELYDPRSVDELYERAVRVVRDVTGFDRVMLYRFDARYNGQVIAESSREGVGSFLGLFFPSSDLGARSRDLYLENFTRYIPDIGGRNFSLSGVFPGGGHADTRHPVDMSHTNLRSVAPCHITYLRNIGVQASMSFSINVDGRLWGLFACHHYTPRRVSYEQRVVCEQAAMMFIYRLATMASTAARMAQRQTGLAKLRRSIVIGAELGRRIALLSRDWRGEADEATAQAMIARAVEAVEAEAGLLISVDVSDSRQLTDAQKLLLDLVEADSAAVVRNGHICRIGDAPPAMSIYAIASMFGRELPDIRTGDLHVFATDSLASVVPAAADIKDRAAGMMAAALSLRSPAFLLWFRREQIVHATWAGNPSADAMSTGTEGQNPRASFEAWKHDIRNLSRPWMLEDVEVAHDLSVVLRDAEAAGEPMTRGAQSLAGALWQNQAGMASPGAFPAGGSAFVGSAGAGPTAWAGGSAGPASGAAARPPGDPAAPTPPPRRVIRIGQR